MNSGMEILKAPFQPKCPWNGLFAFSLGKVRLYSIFELDFENIFAPFWVKPGLDDLCLTLLQRMHFGDRKLHQSLVVGTNYGHPLNKVFFWPIGKIVQINWGIWGYSRLVLVLRDSLIQFFFYKKLLLFRPNTKISQLPCFSKFYIPPGFFWKP